MMKTIFEKVHERPFPRVDARLSYIGYVLLGKTACIVKFFREHSVLRGTSPCSSWILQCVKDAFEITTGEDAF